MSIKLSICIPTYNRVNQLQACLKTLIPQVAALPTGLVEIVIVNNASPDNTEQFIAELSKEYSFVRAYNNPTNWGIDGNTAKCIEYAAGEYMALLSDDDYYLDSQVEQILDRVSKQDYCLIRLNFHSFLEDMYTPYQTFHNEEDVVFPRASEMLTFFHGGHYSGVIYRSELAKQALAKMLALRPLTNTGRSRGIYGEVEIRIIMTSDLPAYFIGKRKLATTIPTSLDYAGLEHICLDYLRSSERIYLDGVIPRAEFERRKQETIGRLPQMIVTFTPSMRNDDIARVTQGLNQYLRNDRRYAWISLPLLYLARLNFVKIIFVLVRRIARVIKRTLIRRSGILVMR